MRLLLLSSSPPSDLVDDQEKSKDDESSDAEAPEGVDATREDDDKPVDELNTRQQAGGLWCFLC